VSGQSYANVARFTTNGSLAATFTNLTSGANNPVYALALQLDNKLVVGGSFTVFSGSTMNQHCPVECGWQLDTANFFAGTGANDVVWNLAYQLDARSMPAAILVVQRNAPARFHPPECQRHGGLHLPRHRLQPVCRFETDFFLRYAGGLCLGGPKRRQCDHWRKLLSGGRRPGGPQRLQYPGR